MMTTLPFAVLPWNDDWAIIEYRPAKPSVLVYILTNQVGVPSITQESGNSPQLLGIWLRHYMCEQVRLSTTMYISLQKIQANNGQSVGTSSFQYKTNHSISTYQH